VILPDTNIWIALTVSGHSHHSPVIAWFDSVPGPGVVRFCRATQQSMLRLLTTAATHASFGDPPLANSQAWRIYAEILSDERVGSLLPEPAGLDVVWQRLSDRLGASPKVWMDAYLAAFAIAGGLTFVTTDKAFRQFTDLDLVLIE
jgi:toxin-antitoxin system PIN domain toxin